MGVGTEDHDRYEQRIAHERLEQARANQHQNQCGKGEEYIKKLMNPPSVAGDEHAGEDDQPTERDQIVLEEFGSTFAPRKSRCSGTH
jgi:hypothetical protein